MFKIYQYVHYSQLCSDDYGAPIHLARFIASHATKEYFDVNDDCRSTSNEFRLAEEEKKRTLVFPNPSTGLVNLQFDQEINGTIKVYNSQGYVLEEQVLNDKLEAFLDMSESIGLHFIEVTREYGESELIKTLILK